MMDAMNIIGRLEALGFTFRLAVDYEYDGEPTPEADELLRRLADDRAAAIDYLVAGRFVPLPDDTPIPLEWGLNAAMKKYIFSASSDILTTIEKGHSPLFALLYAAKGLCFFQGGKMQYEAIEAAVRDLHGFDYEYEYAEGWKRYVALLETSQGEARDKLPEYLDVQARLKDMGARL